MTGGNGVGASEAASEAASPYRTGSEGEPGTTGGASEFMQDANLGFFYAGDFCSYLPSRNPGIEAAALSGIAAAQQMANIARMSSSNYQENK